MRELLFVCSLRDQKVKELLICMFPKGTEGEKIVKLHVP